MNSSLRHVLCSLVAGAAVSCVAVCVVRLLRSQGANSSESSKIQKPRLRDERGIKEAIDCSPPLEPQVEPVSLLIVYGSASGTAEALAKEFAVEAGERINDVKLHRHDDDPTQLWDLLARTTLHVWVVATTGEGQPPQSFIGVFRSLQKIKGPQSFAAESFFSVVALGDSTYRHYVQAGRDVATALGAHCQPLGDHFACVPIDRHGAEGIDISFDKWKERFFTEAARFVEVRPCPTTPPATKYKLELLPAAATSSATLWPFPAAPSLLQPTVKSPAIGVISSVSPKSVSSHVAMVTIDTSAFPGLIFEAGDHVGVFAPNSDATIVELLSFFQIPEVQWHMAVKWCPLLVSKARATSASLFPSRCTLWNALKWHMDLSCVPRLATLKRLARYCSNPTERDVFLDRLTQAPLFFMDPSAPSPIRLISVLQKHIPSCREAGIAAVLESLPRSEPRYYSIASDPVSHPEKQIVIVVKEVEAGLASSFLVQAAQHTRLPFFVRPSTFHLPRSLKKPLLLIGPGTGVAPILGLLQRRHAMIIKAKKHRPSAEDCGRVWFLHGCRYEEDWLQLLDSTLASMLNDPEAGTSMTQSICISRGERNSPDTTKPVSAPMECCSSLHKYVTDALRTHSKWLVAEFLNGDGCVFVCGSASPMSVDVERVLLDSLISELGVTDEVAQRSLVALADKGRYLKDVW